MDEILKRDEYYAKGFYSKRLDLDNGEDLKLIVVPDNSNLESKIKENDKELIIIFIIVMLLAFPLSYFISIIPAKLKNKVDKLNENLLQEAKEKDILLSLFDLSNTVLFKWNNDASWSVNFVSKSVNSLLEYSKDDFETNSISYSNCIHPDDIEQVTQELEEAIEKGEYFFKHHPYRVVTKSKKIKWILDQTVIVRNDKNEIINFVGYLSDITEIKEREIELKVLARTDQLTKIYNRVYLDEVLYNQHYRYKRNKEVCSIILIDIDYFKEVNDKYGHIVGDKVLIEFAQLLEESVRDSDIVGRWGGEEFLIVLPHTIQSEAKVLAEKLRKKIETHRFDVVVHKTASFGVCSFSDEISIEKLIDKADIALYEAKKSGRNKVVLCHLSS
jgi:diguanylate cyclase (GGDEF)-like protein/PAS domain S-box-containing protein